MGMHIFSSSSTVGSCSKTDKQSEKFYNGQRIAVENADGLYKIYKDGAFYGIGEVVNGLAKAKTKLC